MLSALLAISWVLNSLPAQADEVYTFVVKKQEEKRKSGWSLAEWIETRDRMRLMDLWLALHSPSPYEFFLSGAYFSDQATPGANATGFKFGVAAYASIFGLSLEREAREGTARYDALFNFRIFGHHAQTTNITLQGGLRQVAPGGATSSLRNPVAGVDMTINLTRFFGVQGAYRHYFEAAPNSLGQTYEGNRHDLGAFIDFKFLRVFGNYFKSGEEGVTRSGTLFGTKLFF